LSAAQSSPDIQPIEKGDLIVNYNVSGLPHIGIVVGLLSEKPAAYRSDAAAYRHNVLVLSVSRGQRTVSVCTWG